MTCSSSDSSACKKSCTQRVFCFFAFLILCGSIVCAALQIREGLQSFRTKDNAVTVKGLATREVQADLAIWALRHTATGNDLITVQQQLEGDAQKISTYLKTQGVADDQISVLSLDMQDLMAQAYRPDNASAGRYILTRTVVVRSNDIGVVTKSAQNTNALLSQGVVLTNTGAPNYLFTKLNDIKPEMIAGATQNARAAAQQFAKDAGQSVAGIKNANQGLFEINGRDQVFDIPETAQINKVVRVVTTVDYYLE